MSNHTYCHHLKHEPQALIDCVQSQCDGQDPYPVLHIGDATFWPSREQLVATRDAIQGYLDAHPIPPVGGGACYLCSGALGTSPVFHRSITEHRDEDYWSCGCEDRVEAVRELTDAEVREMF